MLTSQQASTAVNRCVETMTRYYMDNRSPRAVEFMKAEVQVVAAWALDMAFDLNEAERLILRPVEDRLFTLYGHEVAPRIFGECLKAFEGYYDEAPSLKFPTNVS